MNEIKEGKIIKSIVTGVQPYGVFVNIDNKFKGLIHVSQISDKPITNLNKLYRKGDTVTAKIIEINTKKKQVRLSVIELKENIKKYNKKLREKGEGFNILKKNLKEWIEDN